MSGTNNIILGQGEINSGSSSNQLNIQNIIWGENNSGTSTTLSTGGIGIGVKSPTSKLDLAASTTSRASLRILSGVAPSSPNDGDFWQDGTHLYAYIGGAARQLDQQSGGGSSFTWTEVTTTSQSAAVNNGYTTNNAALVTVTIPTSCAVGDTVQVSGVGAGGWQIAQNASEIIHFGNMDTTTGTGGYLASTHRRDSVELVCVVANTEWNVIKSVGNITIN